MFPLWSLFHETPLPPPSPTHHRGHLSTFSNPDAMASGTQTLDTPSLFLTAYASYSAHSNTDDPPPLLSPLPHDIPHSKLIPATRFLVDGFRFAGGHSVSYFLSHFHSDHYAGLTPAWCKGVIFCSEVTARLLVETLKVPRFFVVGLSLCKTVSIDGCEVTLVDANHCPGAVQFLFKVPRAEGEGFLRYVHTGDFRFHESMKSDSILGGFVGSDAVFLDTTYCNPKFTFPSQDESVEYVVSTIDRTMAQSKGSSERVLFLIATYVVGKERILVEVSRRCNCMVHVDDVKKLGVLRILGYGDSRIFTDDTSVTDVHVIGWNLLGETWPFFCPNFVKMGEMMRERGYAKAVGFVPTGWMYETKRDGFAVRVKDSLEIHLVPYSEHSSYSELREYIRFLRPKRVIPTVGLDIEKLDSKSVVAMQKHFACLVDQTANKQDFLADFWQRKRNAEEREGHNLDIGSNHGGQVKSDEDMKKDNDPSTPNVDKDTEQEASLQSADTLDKNMEVTIEELSYSLPSWVTRDQMLGLLTSSGGDIVEAVSEFYEYETDLFEQVNCSSASVSHVGLSGNDTEGSKSRSVTKILDCSINPKSVLLKLTNRNIVNSKTISPKKRGSTVGSKPKKKGKKHLTSELSGSKQSAITKFFQKLVYQPPCESRHGSSKAESQDTRSEDRMQLSVDPAESYSDELDQFLEIINFGTPRKSAASFLEKANGNLNVALELYYSISCSTSFNEYIPNVCSIDVHPQGSADYNNTDNKEKPSKEIIDLRTSSTQDNMVADISATLVSLPVENYSPIEHACWKAGQPAPYLHLARTFDLVEQEKGKLKTSAILCNMFRSLLALSPEDVLAAVYLCTNKISPDHENTELNVGYGMVTAALEEACGMNRSKLREMYNDLGDLGDVAQICRQTQSLLAPPRPLSVKTLFSAFQRMSMETGAGCAIRRKNIIIKLMCSCREKEIKFLVRTLVRNLRIGAMMKTILPSLAQAVVLQHQEGPFESLREKLQLISTEVVEAYNIIPNLDLLIPALLSKNIDFSSSSLLVVPGMPIPSMLARITNGIPQVLKSFHGRAFTCEYKYDGQRAQIHRELDGSIMVFSRNMGDITAKYPDLVETIQKLCKPMVKTFILDSEVAAVDRKNENRLMAFQHLSTRERGSKCSSIAIDSIKVDICIFVFDIMFYNGQQLLALPLRERRKYLSDLISNEKLGYLEFAKEITVEADRASLNDQGTLSEVHSFLEDACRSSCEGIMVKSLDVDSRYAASKRTDAWLKVKRDYVEGLGDSVDLVPIGAWHGNGRKAKWYSPFLMACYNPDTEEFQSVCRIMSGFSDSFYAEMKEYFSGDKILPRKPPYYRTDEVPDLWLSSELVWEIRGAEFTISPVHHAAIGLVHPSRGISIRFPRCICTMLDKKPEDCSTATDIANMFQSQSRKMEVNV